MTDREFWMIVRQALLLFVSAIERRYKLGKHAETVVQSISERDSIAVIK
jgi:hypothetical protein